VLADILGCLACPVCGSDLGLSAGSLGCENGHAFDVAKQGYVNLLPGRAKTGTADTAQMVEARDTVLGAGYFVPLTRALVGLADSAVDADVPGCVLDVGAGTGYYLAELLAALPGRAGVALDISKHAARVAARAHEHIGSIVSDVWGPLPLKSGSTALVVCVFSPRNAAEFSRVLAPGGALIVATPTPHHLRELVEGLGLLTVDEDKPERLARTLEPDFEQTAEQTVEAPLVLRRAEIAAVVGMGPSAYHVTDEELTERMEGLEEPVHTALSVRLSVWRPRPQPAA